MRTMIEQLPLNKVDAWQGNGLGVGSSATKGIIMRQKHPTIQAVCEVHGLSEFYQAQRAGTDTLVKTNCVQCRRAGKKAPAKKVTPALVESLSSSPTPELGQRLGRELKHKYGTYELEQVVEPTPEPVHDPAEDRYPNSAPWFGALKDPTAFYERLARLQGDDKPRLTLAQERRALAVAVAARARTHPGPRLVTPGGLVQRNQQV